MAALAAAGAIVIGGTSAMMFGTGTAAPLDILGLDTPGNQIVLPDLEPFVKDDTRGDGKAEVSDEYGAPTGGGKAALRLSTPTGADKVNYYAPVGGAAAKLDAWIPTAAYSAYQGAADNPIQFPSLQLTVDFNGDDAGGYSNLTYEPVYNTTTDSTTPNEWHRYQAGAGQWCSTQPIPDAFSSTETRCNATKSLAEISAAAPKLVVGRVVINQGSGNPGLESAVDLITTPTTTYDFELTKPEPPVVIPDPTDPTEPTEPTTEPEHPGGDHDGEWGHEGGGKNDEWGHEDGGKNDDGCRCP